MAYRVQYCFTTSVRLPVRPINAGCVDWNDVPTKKCEAVYSFEYTASHFLVGTSFQFSNANDVTEF